MPSQQRAHEGIREEKFVQSKAYLWLLIIVALSAVCGLWLANLLLYPWQPHDQRCVASGLWMFFCCGVLASLIDAYIAMLRLGSNSRKERISSHTFFLVTAFFIFDLYCIVLFCIDTLWLLVLPFVGVLLLLALITLSRRRIITWIEQHPFNQ